jgi:hypothetical protein
MFWFDVRHPETGEWLEVEATYQPPWRGSRDRYGVPEEPDDPEELEICRVCNKAGEEVPFAEIEGDLVEAGLREVRDGNG